jgi:hypothetical protein
VEVWPFSWEGILDGDGYINAWSLQLESGEPAPPPPPPNRPPVAVDDSFVGNDVNENVTLTTAQILANDTDPDGDTLSVTFFSAPVGGTVTLAPNGVIIFDPDPLFEGQAGFDYVVSDGTFTDVGHVSIDIEPEFQWHNLVNPLDVNNDKSVSPIDAVLIINLLNANPGGTSLEGMLSGGGASPTTYYDVAPDNFVAPNDAVLVINYLNANPPGSSPSQTSSASMPAEPSASESETAAAPTATSTAIVDSPHPARRIAAERGLDIRSLDLLLAQLADRGPFRRRR